MQTLFLPKFPPESRVHDQEAHGGGDIGRPEAHILRCYHTEAAPKVGLISAGEQRPARLMCQK